jgi:hypothetical protein
MVLARMRPPDIEKAGGGVKSSGGERLAANSAPLIVASPYSVNRTDP